MADQFLSLPREDQALLLKQYAPDLDMLPFVLEKDIWLCWALQQLFNMPEQLPMAFKGGTSLSKVYRAIDRFSEDLDVTLDYRAFGETVTGNESRSALTRISEKLKELVLKHTRDKVKPYFEEVLSQQFGASGGKVELSKNGEQLYIHYPSAFDEKTAGYMPASVLIEFGGRNITEPNELHKVRPYMSTALTNYAFPEPIVTVLALQRTYWEKATLVHVECNRPSPRSNAERLSRHWYDLHQMSKNLTDFQSSSAQDLLADVVCHKKMFFHYGYADYESCLSGALRLVPPEELKKSLEVDFNLMVDALMFYQAPPPFKEILTRLVEVEQLLNKSIVAHSKRG